MSKLYRYPSGFLVKMDYGYHVSYLNVCGGFFRFSPNSGNIVREDINQGLLTLIANNYQEKPKCSQRDSRSSSCHAS